MKAKRRCSLCEQQPIVRVRYRVKQGSYERRFNSERCATHYKQLRATREAGRVNVRIEEVSRDLG